MTNDELMTKHETKSPRRLDNRATSSFSLRASFVIRHWSFVIPQYPGFSMVSLVVAAAALPLTWLLKMAGGLVEMSW
jgi:hypothetical protein